MSTPLTVEIVSYCAAEVGRQYAYSQDAQRAANAVGWMVDAWQWAQHRLGTHMPMTPETIKALGKLVEPGTNATGFRTCNVFVGQYQAPGPGLVPHLIDEWLERYVHASPDEAYRAYQEIHPFRDGNGRTGKILFNWLNNSLDHPVMPPNFWNCANP